MLSFKKIAVITAISICAFSSVAAQANDCPSCAPSNASEALSLGVGLVLVGSMSMVAASGAVIVQSVESAAEGVTLVIKGSGNAASATLKLSAKTLHGVVLVSGSVIETSVVSTGYLLVYAGKAIAFIPNEVGNALIYHTRAE